MTAPAMSSLQLCMPMAVEPDPRNELMQLCKRTDTVTSECHKTRERLLHIQNRSTAFVNAEDLDASRDAMIAEMEDELANNMHSIRDAFAQRKTYEWIINRIKAEERSYGKELAAIDTAAAAKTGDIEQLKLMLRDAEHVRDVARKDLIKLEEQSERERHQQRAALQERRRKLEARLETVAACELRCAQRLNAIEVEHAAVQARVEQVAMIEPAQFQAEHEHIRACEEQFTQIKQILGVLKVDDIIDKFSQQEEAAKTLEALIIEYQGRIDALHWKRVEMKKAVDALRYGRGVAQKLEPEGVAERLISQTERLANLKDGRHRWTRLNRASALLTEARVAIDHLGNVVSSSPSLPADRAANRGLGGPKAGLAGISLAELQEMLRVHRVAPTKSTPEGLCSALKAHMQALREMHARVLASDLQSLPFSDSVLGGQVEETGRGVEPGELSATASSPEVSPVIGARERRRAFTAAESDAVTLASLQGPIFKREDENWRVDAEDETGGEEENEEADPDDPTDPVIDRKALKLRAEREVKKHIKAANRRKVGRAAKKDEDAEA